MGLRRHYTQPGSRGCAGADFGNAGADQPGCHDAWAQERAHVTAATGEVTGSSTDATEDNDECRWGMGHGSDNSLRRPVAWN